MKLNAHDIEDFYSKYVAFDDAIRTKGRGDSVEVTTKCPFHKDDTPSLSINLTKGLYKCHAQACPQSGGGNIYQFYAAVNDVDVSVARQKIYEMYKKEPKKIKDFPVTEDHVQAWHVALLNNATMLKWLKKNCRYTEQTLEDFELGWNGKEITIPIRKNGQLINIRRYSPNAKGKKVIGISNFNTSTLWPVDNMDDSTIYIMEGEKDCMLANQLGLTAVTSTGGAGKFRDQWREYFIDKDVIICYDIDESGVEGAKIVADILAGSASSVKIVNLPLTVPENGDFTDYILQKNTVQDFHALVDKTEPLKVKNRTRIEIKDDVKSTTLEEASYEENFFARLRIKVRILGKDLAPFIIPKEIEATCAQGRKPKCIGCGLQQHKYKYTLVLDETRPELLAFLNCSTAQQNIVLRQALNVPAQCSAYKVLYTAHQFVEEVSVIPYIDEQTFDSEYLRRTMYALNHKLEANRDYEVESLTVPDPRTQYLVHIVYASKPCETSVEEFKMSNQLFEKLRVFQCVQNQSEDGLTISTTTSQQT